ncbi:hypothetical protein [Streptomyces sp. CAU 1734]|uniref:hypothetical protein n=1 Tax=Streptomyces sp. CAU 1734 TaxID=3140360 RepID=UPI0032607044
MIDRVDLLFTAGCFAVGFLGSWTGDRAARHRPARTQDCPSGECGDRTVFPIGGRSAECVLRSRHPGSHADGRGNTWTRITTGAAPARWAICLACGACVPSTHIDKHHQREHGPGAGW